MKSFRVEYLTGEIREVSGTDYVAAPHTSVVEFYNGKEKVGIVPLFNVLAIYPHKEGESAEASLENKTNQRAEVRRGKR
jgi:hypothetical protein